MRSLPAESPLNNSSRSNAAPVPINAFNNTRVNDLPPPAYNTPTPPSLPNRTPSQPPSKPEIARATALYRYAEPEDCTFEVGDQISVFEYMNADWWLGKNLRTDAVFAAVDRQTEFGVGVDGVLEEGDHARLLVDVVDHRVDLDAALGHGGAQVGQKDLRHGEGNEDRIDLIDRGEHGRGGIVADAQGRAGLVGDRADAARDRRADLAVSDLGQDVLAHGLVRLKLRLGRLLRLVVGGFGLLARRARRASSRRPRARGVGEAAAAA